MANKVFLDGIDYTGSVLGVDDFSVTYAKDDSTNSTTIGVSSSLTFIRGAYDYLKAKFFDAGIVGRDAEVKITIQTECCNDSYDFFIRGDAVTICFDTCKIETAGFDRSNDQVALNSIRQYGILRKGQPILTQTTPKIPYCLDAGWISMTFYVIFGFFLNLIQALLSVVGISSNLLNGILASLLGCYGSKRLFYLRNIFEDIAQNAGLVPVSSFLQNGTYTQAAWLDTMSITPLTVGDASKDQSELFANEWLDIVALVFNAEWQVRNGILYLERKDFFFNLNETLVDVDQAKKEGLAETLCYSFSDVSKFAYGRYSFSDDSGDKGASIALGIYGDIVEWNVPFDFNKKGVYEKKLPIGAARFNGDEFSYDNLGNFFGQILVGDRPYHALLLDKAGQRSQLYPKIIVLQPQSNNDPDFWNAQPTGLPPPNNEPWAIINTPIMFREGDANALYENFFKIDDPRQAGQTPYQIDEFEFLANCEQIDKIRTFGLNLIIETRLGQGIAEEIEINYVTKIVTLKNVKIKV